MVNIHGIKYGRSFGSLGRRRGKRVNLQARQRKYIMVSKAKIHNIIYTSRAEQSLNDRAVGFAASDGMARLKRTKNFRVRR